MRLFTRATAIAATGLATLSMAALSAVAPASAAPSAKAPVDITKVNVKDQVISAKMKLLKIDGLGKRCINVPMSLSYKTIKPGVQKDWAGVVAIGDRTANGPVFAYFAPGMAASTTLNSTGASAFVCDTAGRLDYEVQGALHSNGKTTYDNPTLVQGSFSIRQDATAKLAASRSGSSVTLTASATYFNLKTGKAAAYNVKNAKVQVLNGKSWKTVKTVSLKNGKASVKLTQKATKSYRLTFDKSASVIAKTSATVKK